MAEREIGQRTRLQKSQGNNKCDAFLERAAGSGKKQKSWSKIKARCQASHKLSYSTIIIAYNRLNINWRITPKYNAVTNSLFQNYCGKKKNWNYWPTPVCYLRSRRPWDLTLLQMFSRNPDSLRSRGKGYYKWYTKQSQTGVWLLQPSTI